jgi:GNAT superfamily N-acetyltransferase
VTDPFEWREEPISRHHDRRGFDCGSPELNEYLNRYARQNHESGGSKTFVAVSPIEPARVLGYYSISPGAIEFDQVPAKLTKKLARYDVPVFRIGRLAVSRSMHGQGLGGDLLLAAGVRALAVAAQIGGVALAIDAKDAKAARWYERFGAIRLLDDPLKLILPLCTIENSVKTVGKKRCA